MAMVIDGSILEGGGQTVRLACLISAILKRPLRVHNIRSGRPKPGLRNQHLEGLKFLKILCSNYAKYWDGMRVGSTEIFLKYNTLDEEINLKLKDSYFINCKTAAAGTLIVQGVFPYIALNSRQMELNISCGTDVSFSPPADYTENVFFHIARNFFKINCELEIKKRGFNPDGKGELSLICKNNRVKWKGITMVDPGNLTKIWGTVYITENIPNYFENIKTMKSIVEEVLSEYSGVDVNIEVSSHATITAKEFGLYLFAETSTGCRYGVSDLKAVDKFEQNLVNSIKSIGKNTATKLIDEIETKACVDRHMQDQIIILMALADGCSKVRIPLNLTLHTKTVMYVIEKLLPVKLTVVPDTVMHQTAVLECNPVPT